MLEEERKRREELEALKAEYERLLGEEKQAREAESLVSYQSIYSCCSCITIRNSVFKALRFSFCRSLSFLTAFLHSLALIYEHRKSVWKITKIAA